MSASCLARRIQFAASWASRAGQADGSRSRQGLRGVGVRVCTRLGKASVGLINSQSAEIHPRLRCFGTPGPAAGYAAARMGAAAKHAEIVEATIGRALASWTGWVLRYPRGIASGTLLLTLALGAYAALNLGINSDNVRMISEDAPFRKLRDEYARIFPILSNSLLIVVDGQTPQLATQSASRLQRELELQPELFQDVHAPGSDAFFERTALLYRTADELDDFVDGIMAFQPLIAALESDPSVARLSRLLEQGLAEVHDGQGADDSDRWSDILDRISRASVGVYEEHPLYLSWDEILLQGSAIELNARRVITVEPVLDFDSILPAGRALEAIRAIARRLELDAEHGVQVRITGNPALSYEEIIGLAWDIGAAGIFCFALVCGVLYAALRSVRLVVAAVVTLLAGLIWTAAFAAVGVGHLNMVSIAFSVLFIGLGVDFAIHLGMQYAERRTAGHPHTEALRAAVEEVGPSLVVCALSTAIGFYVFVPTDYLGVAELGLIAGTSMPIILLLTFTLFPALLSCWLQLPEGELSGVSMAFNPRWAGALARHPRAVLGSALALGGVAVLLAPKATFDANVVQMRNPDTESVQVFNELLAQRGRSSPWYVNVFAPSAEEADSLIPALRALPTVSHVVTLADYVPDDQQEKLEILADLAMVFDTPPTSPQYDEPRLEEQIAALETLRDFLSQTLDGASVSPLSRSAAHLKGELDLLLEKLAADGDATAAIARFESILLSTLPDQLARLRTALDPGEVTFDQLPERLVTRMRAPGGEARVQVFPERDLQQGDALEEFVSSVREIAPGAVGMAVDLVEFSRVTVQSLEQALISALVVITLLLLALWRRLADTVLVMLPLLLAGAMTVATVYLLGLSFNFANVIVLPLLLGIGIDSGIHLVHRARSAGARGADLLAETTARAVFYSAVTTIASFGSLAFSSHRGVSSLGVLLVIGIVYTLVANLVVLPALLAVMRDRSK